MTTASPSLDRAWRRARPYSTTSGFLLAASGLPPVVSGWTLSSESLPRYGLLAGIGLSSLCLLASGWIIPKRPSAGRWLASLGSVGTVVLAAPSLSSSPFLALAVALLVIAVLALLWNVGGTHGGRLRRRRRLLENRARGAAATATLLWLCLVFQRESLDLFELGALGFSLGLAAFLGLLWAWLERRDHRSRSLVLVLALFAAIALGSGLSREPARAVDPFVLIAVTTLFAMPPHERTGLQHTIWWEPLLGHPERLFTGTFAALCAVGALVLALPFSAERSGGISFIDALFTAVSAVCVTGLSVLDTPHDLGGFGQAVLLLLIQLGGLGIMTFSTAALRVFGGRMSLRHEGAVASLISPRDRSHIFDSAQQILLLTVGAELFGSLVLWGCFFAHGDGVGMALWRATFTAISAFCNAGFALQTDSLIPYQSQPLVLHTVALLIIVGGLAPAAVFALPDLVRRRRSRVSMQSKLSLTTAGILLVLGFVLTLAFEWDNSLARLSILDRVHNAWFHSVTLRTAGFNSIEMSQLRPATVSMMLIWMFIGGSPGGTAGGIKTTTLAVLVLGVVSAVRGQWDVTVFGRRLALRTLQKATVITTLGVGAVFLGILALQLTQDLSPRAAVFEVVSASATVGLSLGATAALDAVGKLIIIMCMFAGRVGPLTILMFLSHRQVSTVLKRPEEEIDVG